MTYNRKDTKGADAWQLGGDTGIDQATWENGRWPRGVFSNYPAATPKYVTSPNNNNDLETMARLFIPIYGGNDVKNLYLSTFGQNSAARRLADTLAVIGSPSENNKTQRGIGYVDFLLQSAQESYQEKIQIADVMGDNFSATVFGRRPPMFSYTGILLNTIQDDWRAAWTILYNDIIRGTELARRGVFVTLSYDRMAVTGLIVGSTQTLTAEMQTAGQVSFEMLVYRLDVHQTDGRTPTSVRTSSNILFPDQFANVQFTEPPKTIRATGTPSSVVVERKDPDKRGDQPLGDVSVSDSIHDDIYNPQVSMVDTTTNDLHSFLRDGEYTNVNNVVSE
jgi:hypothetical protein